MNTKKTLGQVAYESAAWGSGWAASWGTESPVHKAQWDQAANDVLAASDYRTMRSLLLRIHSARVAMNEAAVIAALDDVDRFFREENTN